MLNKAKILLFAAALLLTGCKEPEELSSIVSVPTPNVQTSAGVSFVQTSLGNVYIGENNNSKSMNGIIKATPASPKITSQEIIVPSKGLKAIFGPTVKYGSDKISSVVTTKDNGGQYAYSIINKLQNGVYANHSVVPNLNLNSSPNNDLNVLYAPTTHAPNSCLEAGSNYWRGQGASSVTVRYVRLYDFCNNVGWNTGIAIPIDQNFINSYVRNFDDETPQYTMEISGNPQSGWSFYLYNYSKNIWDNYYTSSPGAATYNGGEGWSLFETHFTLGPCSNTPLIEATGIQVLENNQWIPSERSVTSFGNCFNNIGGNSTFAGTNNDNSWAVQSV